MNKEQVITDEMACTFASQMAADILLGRNAIKVTPQEYISGSWEQFKASHQPPKNEWEVVEYEDIEHTVIKKIIRKLDSAPLEVGKEYEIVIASSKIKSKIIELKIIDNNLHIDFEVFPGRYYSFESLTSIVECKGVMLVTHDGKEIMEGMGFIGVNKHTFQKFHSIASVEDYFNSKLYLAFSTDKAADFFLSEHKPDKSYAMIREALLASNRWNNESIDLVIKGIEIGSRKLKKNQ